ncbi:MAG: alpha/beta fold hydrolase [Desulfobacterales bacterium]|nr:alpha/beta fold hydrolase [Desulfobacterales bacterium]
MKDNSYNPPFLFGNGHIQTIYPVLFRKINDVTYTRERIATPDNDFLDLDWSPINSKRLAVISHGLEGDTSRNYIKGMVRAVNQGGWDALAWNYRGCSGEPNTQLRSYHNGATDDLSHVINHAAKTRQYDEIALIGFSLGGNLTLVHLGRDKVHPLVSRAVTFSVPCDLESAATVLANPSNKLYMKRFLILLHQKIRDKMKLMPHALDDEGYEKIKTFKEFDDRYTAPIHGFSSAEDYWRKCSSNRFIPNIKHPVLLINAENDPFLSKQCFPVAQAGYNKSITLRIPKSGGHVGFLEFNRDGLYWSEKQALSFLNGHF